jgi:hypothetical protein
MRLTCPSCGATASVEAWQNDAYVRYFIEAIVALPSPVLRQTLAYLGLFRKNGKSLSWPQALGLARDMRSLVETGTVHWQGCETRPCTAEIWAAAMEATLAAAPKGLKNHNYLRQVAWEKAEELARKTETDRETARKRRTREIDEEPMPMGETARQAVTDLKKKWGEV